MSNRINLNQLILKSGSHANPEAGMCIMEAVAYFNKEPHSDKPQCACPVLTAYMIKLNDSLSHDERQLLKPYIRLLVGTRDGKSQKRLDILVNAACAKFTPYALRIVGLEDHAKALEAVKPNDWKGYESAAYAAAYAARSAESAAYAAASAAAYAARSAESAAYAAASAARSEGVGKNQSRSIVIQMILSTIDKALKV